MRLFIFIILSITSYSNAQTFDNNYFEITNSILSENIELDPLVVLPPTSENHTGTVIFLHGSGWTGIECEQIYVADVMGRKFEFPHLKVMFPTAPLQPYTVLGGELSHVWFDRYAVNSSYPENYESIQKMHDPIMRLIEKENELGILNDRIVLGGISMGGAMAFYTGFGWDRSFAGVFALSSFLNSGSFVYDVLESTSDRRPSLLQYHGAMDSLVPLSTGIEVFKNLTELGVKGLLNVYPDGVHLPNKDQLIDTYYWIQRILPPL